MYPIAKIDIVNQALLEIGSLPVIQDTDTQQSQVISAKIDILFPELLASAPFNFAVKFIYDNTPLSTTLTPDFLYNYQLPADYGRLFKFGDNSFPISYQLMAGVLMTSLKPVQYYYVVNSIDYNKLSVLFYRALSIYVAADVAPALTNNTALAERLFKKYQRKLQDAIMLNDMERMIVSAPNDYDRNVYI